LRIVIGNSGRRREGEQRTNGNGVGLSNTVERLKTLYGADHNFCLNGLKMVAAKSRWSFRSAEVRTERRLLHARVDRR